MRSNRPRPIRKDEERLRTLRTLQTALQFATINESRIDFRISEYLTIGLSVTSKGGYFINDDEMNNETTLESLFSSPVIPIVNKNFYPLLVEVSKNIDSFVEVMLGKTGSRVNLTGQKTLPLLDYTNVEDFKKEIEKYKVFLINMNKDAGINITNNSDLLNIRDELLANLNQFTYLLTFK